MLFLGEYIVSFSGKGRLVVPKKIRILLGEKQKFTLTKGYDACLSGYREEDWIKGAQELLQSGVIVNTNLIIKRHIFSSAVELDIDEQGRVVIPSNLLEYAKLTDAKEAFVIGVGDHFEIWEVSLWKEYREIAENKINRNELL